MTRQRPEEAATLPHVGCPGKLQVATCSLPEPAVWGLSCLLMPRLATDTLWCAGSHSCPQGMRCAPGDLRRWKCAVDSRWCGSERFWQAHVPKPRAERGLNENQRFVASFPVGAVPPASGPWPALFVMAPSRNKMSTLAAVLSKRTKVRTNKAMAIQPAGHEAGEK